MKEIKVIILSLPSLLSPRELFMFSIRLPLYASGKFHISRELVCQEASELGRTWERKQKLSELPRAAIIFIFLARHNTVLIQLDTKELMASVQRLMRPQTLIYLSRLELSITDYKVFIGIVSEL